MSHYDDLKPPLNLPAVSNLKNLAGTNIRIGDEVLHIFNGHGGIVYETAIVVRFTPKRVGISSIHSSYKGNQAYESTVRPKALLPLPNSIPMYDHNGLSIEGSFND